MKFILGTKQNMMQVYDADGVVTPVTVINAGPIVVTQIKDKTKDGYSAVQVGFGVRKAKNINKAQKGHFKELGNFSSLKEFPITGDDKFTVGDKMDSSVFKEGDIVAVTATSKGKGFQGVVKRHGFKGGPRSHGQKHSEREPGSIGGGLRTGPRKGKRMGGRMGTDTITVKNLKIVQVNPAENLILVSGAVPGRRGTVLEIKG